VHNSRTLACELSPKAIEKGAEGRTASAQVSFEELSHLLRFGVALQLLF
jgi:hypothetical protein